MRDGLDQPALAGMDEALASPLYTTAELNYVGMGHFECNGAFYWTVLAAAPAGQSTLPPPPGPEMPSPVPTEAPKPARSAMWSWLEYWSKSNPQN